MSCAQTTPRCHRLAKAADPIATGLRATGRPSTPRPIGSIAGFPAYWIPAFAGMTSGGAMTSFEEDTDTMLNFYGKTFSSRLLIGSALYPSPAIMQDAIRSSGANIVTVSLRREAAGGKTGDAFWSLIRELGVTVLPNTAGCRSVREAVTTAKLARELFSTPWIKLEVIADNDTLQPDVVGLVEAAAILIKDGFEVFPYCTEDLSVAMRLVDAGCKVVMPWAAPIGSAKGITNRDALKLMRERLPDITLVVDAGLGAPSHAAHALELGYDAVLLNTAIAKAADPVAMANAFRLGVEAGRTAYEAGLMEARDFASPSTPVIGTPFWHAVS